jgi:hypothetical protein
LNIESKRGKGERSTKQQEADVEAVFASSRTVEMEEVEGA